MDMLHSIIFYFEQILILLEREREREGENETKRRVSF